MKLTCEVQLNNRVLPVLNMRKSGKPARSQLILGKKPYSADKTIYIMVSTAQNPSGNVFKVRDNIEAVHCKFVTEGKANIRIKQPQTDILISKADSIQLKLFLQTLKIVILKGALDEEDQSKLSSLGPVTGKTLDKLKTRTSILEKSKYPILDGFAPTLQYLQINNCNLKRLDSRIIQLKQLSHLDLASNRMTRVPVELRDLSLSSLNLSNNRINEFSEDFCKESALNASLRTLNVSDNDSLQKLPTSIHNFSSLHTLKADRCSIIYVPSRIGLMKSLKVLSLSENRLRSLPQSFLRLSLDEVSFYKNPFISIPEVKLKFCFLSLEELSARAVKLHRVVVTRRDVSPATWEYLHNARKCYDCNGSCFDSFACYPHMVDLREVVTSTCHTVDSAGGTRAPVEYFFCSRRCFLKKYV